MSVFSSSIIIYDPRAKQVGYELKWKKQGVITCRMDQELNESKMFIIDLLETDSSWKAHHKVKRSVL